MRGKLWIFAAAVVLAIGSWGCSDSSAPVVAPNAPGLSDGTPTVLYLEAPCGDQMEAGLVTRNQQLAGFVTVANDQQTLQVTLDTSGLDWVLAKSHLTVMKPHSRQAAGRPTVFTRGRYNFSERHDPPVTLWNYDIDLAELGLAPGDQINVALRAVVQILDEDGNPVVTERAWALSQESGRPRGSMFLGYEIQDCPEEPDPCTLTFLYPNGGEFFCAGWPVELQWDSSWCGSEVMIELLWDDRPCTTIAEAAENSGTFSWYAAPCNWETSGYGIRVTDLESGVSDDSDETFVIGECGE